MRFPWVPAALLAVALGTPAHADVDLNGVFAVRGEVDTHGVVTPPVVPITCQVSFTAVGTTLSVDATCTLVGSVTLTGTLNPTTGEFSASGGSGAVCNPGSVAITGSATPDGYSISGTIGCLFGAPPIVASGPFTGSRCGNGLIDAGEDCDAGTVNDAECCSGTCHFEPSGSTCATDGNDCTDDGCDGAGTCTHPDNNAECDDGSECTVDDVCGGGVCQPGTAAPSGSACDSDADLCTVEECDGAGACVTTGSATTCDPCSVCAPAFGCVGDVSSPNTCNTPEDRGSRIVLKNRSPDTRDSASWTWGKGFVPPTDFGTPNASTSYRFCVFGIPLAGSNQAIRTIATTPAAAGAGWTSTPSGFKFKGASGVSTLRLKGGPHGTIKLKGKGAGLAMPADFSGVAGAIAELRADNGKCWSSRWDVLGQIQATPTLIKGRHGGSPSGAFVSQ